MRLMVLLSRVDEGPRFVPATGESIPNIYPGRHTIQVMGGLSQSYVESIRLGDVDVSGRPFDLWDGSQPIRVTVRTGGAWIRGTVENAAAATVVVMDADESVTTKTSRTYSHSGPRFEIGPLRPGDYYVFAVDRPTPLDLSDAAGRALLESAQKVHLEKNGVAMMTLKVVR
jgi:hypothetical protein